MNTKLLRRRKSALALLEKQMAELAKKIPLLSDKELEIAENKLAQKKAEKATLLSRIT